MNIQVDYILAGDVIRLTALLNDIQYFFVDGEHVAQKHTQNLLLGFLWKNV